MVSATISGSFIFPKSTAPVFPNFLLSFSLSGNTPGVSSIVILLFTLTFCNPFVKPLSEEVRAFAFPARALINEDFPTFGYPRTPITTGSPLDNSRIFLSKIVVPNFWVLEIYTQGFNDVNFFVLTRSALFITYNNFFPASNTFSSIS